MKKIIALFLCSATIFCLTACSSDSNRQNDFPNSNIENITDAGDEDTVGDDSISADNTDNVDKIYSRDYGVLTYQETYTPMSEEDFNTAVANSLICVHTNGGGEFKFYLDYDLNILALHCADWRAVAVMDNLEYIDLDMDIAQAAQEVFLRMYDIFPPDDWNVPMDIVITCEMGTEGLNRIKGPIVDGILDITNYLCIFPQTYVYYN